MNANTTRTDVYVDQERDVWVVLYTLGGPWMRQVFGSRRAAFDFAAQVREGRAA